MRKLILLLLLSLTLTAGSDLLLRFPSISHDGSKIAFNFQGDIWVTPFEGGNAVRLTIHEAYDGNPIWSPDDKHIAFSSDRFGNNDVYVTSVKGGIPNRLTYRSTNDAAVSWTNDNEILFTTNREFVQVEWMSEVHKISVDGGTPERFMNSVGFMHSMSPNGKFVAFVRGECRISREEYRGPANKDIWLYDIEKKSYKQLTTDEGNDYMPLWSNDNTLYFISAKSGAYNIVKLNLDSEGNASGEQQAVTDFNESGISYFGVNSDASKFVYERLGDVYTLVSGKSPKKLSVNISDDYRFDPIEYKTFSADIDEYKVSPNGKLIAFVIRGEVFVKENDKDKSRSVNLSKNPYRDQHPAWLNDSTLIYISDRDGQNDIFLVKSADEKQPNLFKSLKHETKKLTNTKEEENWPVVSPDMKKLAYEKGNGKLLVVDIDKDGNMSNEVELLNGWDAPGNVTWSPDSKWLAYSLNDLNFNSEVFIHAADNSKAPVNVSMHPRGDYSPFWSKDGSKLGFVSARNNGDNDIWFVWLTKKDWEKTKEDWEEKEDDTDKKDKKKDDKDAEKRDEVEPIKIDFDGMWERIVQVTSLPGEESSYIISGDGEYFYFTSSEPTTKGNDLYKVKWDGSDIKSITKGGKSPTSLSLSADGKTAYFLSRGKLNNLTLSSDKDESLPHSANMTIDYVKELDQIFEEAWRAINLNFYDPNFHGDNWSGLKEKYKPITLRASTMSDFRDYFNLMLGEINASHMGLYGSDRTDTQKERTGILGIEFEVVSEGVKITHVIPGSPADREESKLIVGDIITSVDGMELNDEVNFYVPFVNKSGDKVLLTVNSKDGNQKEVVIRPTTSLRSEQYDEWVKERRKLTDKYSNGKLGYLHIQGMSWPSFERFERELAAAGYGKDGIVIDVRYNGGGWTTDYLMTVLNVKQHAYTIPRGAASSLENENTKFKQYYPYGERLPYSPWMKPSIAMCNSASYSNAEIFSHAYKTLGIGQLVGQPTFGAVISTGGKRLIDDSLIRLPFRAWYVYKTGENMELGPAVPNILVNDLPDSKAKDEDPQLKRAVDELMKQISN